MDGELEETERSLLEQHLDGCPNCRREFESLSFTNGIVGRSQWIELHPGIWAGISSQISQMERRPHRGIDLLRHFFQNRWIPVSAFAALILVIFLSLFFAERSTPSPTEQKFRHFIVQREQLETRHLHNFQVESLKGQQVSYPNPFESHEIDSPNPFSSE